MAVWWVALVFAALFNIAFWFWTLAYAHRGKVVLPIGRTLNHESQLIWLSGVYVFVCAFRSILPRADVQRICLFDTWWSSVFVGRTLATLAELAFMAQWTIVIRRLASETGIDRVMRLSGWFMPLIGLAEAFSWYAVVRTHYLGNAIEESLWAITYVLISAALVDLMTQFKGAFRLAIQFAVFGSLMYVLFMVYVDIPMYLRRLLADSASNKPLLGLWDGLKDLNTRWIVTHNIQDWRDEIPWQTLYFTVAVLVSIALCYVPVRQDRIAAYLKTS